MVPPLSILGSKQYGVEISEELSGGEEQSLPSSGCLLFLYKIMWITM